MRQILEYPESLDIWPYSTSNPIEIASFSIVIFQSGLLDMLQLLLSQQH